MRVIIGECALEKHQSVGIKCLVGIVIDAEILVTLIAIAIRSFCSRDENLGKHEALLDRNDLSSKRDGHLATAYRDGILHRPEMRGDGFSVHLVGQLTDKCDIVESVINGNRRTAIKGILGQTARIDIVKSDLCARDLTRFETFGHAVSEGNLTLRCRIVTVTAR